MEAAASKQEERSGRRFEVTRKTCALVCVVKSHLPPDGAFINTGPRITK